MMKENKYYAECTLEDVAKDIHLSARLLDGKVDRILESAEHKFNGEDGMHLKDRIDYAAVYINEVDCDELGVSMQERRVYEDAVRSVKHAAKLMEDAIEKIKFAKAHFVEAIEKADIAKAVAKHKQSYRFQDIEKPSTKSCE